MRKHVYPIHTILVQLRRVLLLFSCTCSSVSAWAQYILPDTFKLEAEPRNAYYFVKPVFGLLQNRSSFQEENRFKQPHAADLRNTHYGVQIGYHTDRLEIETGIMNLPIATGYHFPFEPINQSLNMTGVGQTRTITYTQVPILARYTFWQPTKRLEVRATAGVGLNWESSNLTMNANKRVLSYTIGSDGVKRVTTTTTDGGHRKSFVTGLVGMGLHYRLNRRFNASLEVNRLFSRQDLVWVDAQVEPYGETQKYTVKTQGGANGFNLQLGIQYQFILRKRNRQF